MLIKKYKAQIADSNIEVIGYLIEQRESVQINVIKICKRNNN